MRQLSVRAQTFAEIQEYLVEGAVDLFEAYGMPVEYSSSGVATLNGPQVMAVIGYASETIRGSLVLLTSPSIVDSLKPREVTGTPPEDILKDVLGEFANMLLGRVKNQLASRQVEPLLSTPMTIFGDDLQLPVPKSGISAWHTFTGSKGPISVRFDATFDQDFSLAPETGVSATLPPGEPLFFFDSSEVEQ